MVVVIMEAVVSSGNVGGVGGSSNNGSSGNGSSNNGSSNNVMLAV